MGAKAIAIEILVAGPPTRSTERALHTIRTLRLERERGGR